ncbi:MAG: YeeE/YedE family protein [Actinomycetia bacterium]|nr:YeeE/YedE family protein [Actinomycetes bacterium]
MSTAFPWVPLFGASPYVYLFFAALIGVGFGWFLERSGFGSAKILTSVFTLRNFQVYKVMFSALLTAMIGSQILSALGLMDLGLLEVNTTYILPMTVGGLLFGVGFYFGGFCPGTAVVSFVRGRLDGLYFLVGIVAGIYAFSLFFDGAGQSAWFQSLYIPSGSTVMTALQSPWAWLWVGGITVLVIASFRYLYIVEQRYSLRTPEQLEDEDPRDPVVKPKAQKATTVVIVVAMFLVVVIGVLQIGKETPEAIAIGTEIPAVVAVDAAAVPVIDPVSLAGWLIADANRAEEDKPPNSHVIDLRSAEERTAVPIRHALVVLPCDTREDEFTATVEMLNRVLTGPDRNSPLVVVDDGNSRSGSDLVENLRVEGINAMLLEGGSIGWQERVLNENAVWPEWIVAPTTAPESVAPAPTVDEYHAEVRFWMTNSLSAPPAYMPVPGTMQLPSEAATVVATGGGGGGCG